jgi:hypothetical protein
VTAAVLGSHRSVQSLSPLEALLAIVCYGIVERNVNFNHTGLSLDAQLGRRGSRSVIGAIRVLENEKTST